MKSILNPSFRYTPSFETDVRKTFERIRREQEAQIQEEQVMLTRRYRAPNLSKEPLDLRPRTRSTAWRAEVIRNS
jgi:hypothetical protein